MYCIMNTMKLIFNRHICQDIWTTIDNAHAICIDIEDDAMLTVHTGTDDRFNRSATAATNAAPRPLPSSARISWH